MNQQPVSYLQTDPRWSAKDYSARGEKTTIGASGCGPTAMAMVLATWADPQVTPATECAWALAHGYKAPRQGTYYGYFPPAAARYGLTCRQMNWSSLYGNPNSSLHAQAKGEIAKGNLVIACMGPGLWTSSGHFVLVWEIRGNTVYLNDPASTKPARTRGDYTLFRRQVKYYFVIERPAKLPETSEEDGTMDIETLIQEMTDQQAYQLLQKAERHAATLPEPAWSKEEGAWKRAQEAGVMDGTGPERYLKRDELAAVLGRRDLL